MKMEDLVNAGVEDDDDDEEDDEEDDKKRSLAGYCKLKMFFFIY